MKPVDHGIQGIILAAGASIRMKVHKALLEFDDGSTLLAREAGLLNAAGCVRIAIVVGFEADKVKKRHSDLAVTWLNNDEWELGQFSSIQLGLAWALEIGSSGVLIQPVDSLASSFSTARSLIETAIINQHVDAIIPEHDGSGGHPVYISKQMALELIKLDPRKADSRLDRQLSFSKKVLRFPVNDPGILKNINTPEDWVSVTSDQ
ncbi:MAG: nucleotidyltransferase family protein [Pseudomonadota bacterium]